MEKKPKPTRIEQIPVESNHPMHSIFDAWDELVMSQLNCTAYDFYRALERTDEERFAIIIAAAMHPDQSINERARKLFRQIDLNTPLCPCKNADRARSDS